MKVQAVPGHLQLMFPWRQGRHRQSSKTWYLLQKLYEKVDKQGEALSSIEKLAGRVDSLESHLQLQENNLIDLETDIGANQSGTSSQSHHQQSVTYNTGNFYGDNQSSTCQSRQKQSSYNTGYFHGDNQPNQWRQNGAQNMSNNFVQNEFQSNQWRPNASHMSHDFLQNNHEFQERRPSCHEHDINSIQVKAYVSKQCDWFAYQVYFEQIANLAGWSDRVKCIKILGALQENLSAVLLGMDSRSITFEQLLVRLDEVHGVSSEKDQHSI